MGKWLAGIVSTVLTSLLVWWFTEGSQPVQVVPKPVYVENQVKSVRTVSFNIHDNLGPGQISEQVTITISGELAGTISVDAYHPSAILRVVVPEPGRHSYSASATAVFMDQYGYQHMFYGSGQGSIYVSGGENFELMGHVSGNTWLISLVKT